MFITYVNYLIIFISPNKHW